MIDEAREALWRVFEKSSKLDDRLEVIRKLSELAVVPGEFDKLTRRLIRLRHEPKLSHDAMLCLVQVHEQAGDTGQARRELERLLPQSPRDPDVLKRLTSLSEATGDLEAAIAHQRRLLEVTRSREADEHLIVLLRRAGRDAEADILATRWLESERDPAKVLSEIDRLIGNAVPAKNQSVHQALKLTQAWLDRDPQNWEFLLRQASALYELNRVKESWAVYDELMALPISDDTPGVLAASRSSGTTPADRTTQRIQQVRSRTNVEKNGQLDFGGARVIVLFARLANKVEPTIPPAVGLDAKATALRTAWDEVYHSFLQGSGTDRLRVRLKLLSLVPNDPGAHWLALTALYGVRAELSVRPLAAWREIDESNPLDADTLDRLVAAFRSLRSCDEAMEWDRTPIIEMLCRELIRAGRKDAVQELLAEMERTSDSPEAFGWLLQQAAINDDTEAALRIMSKFTSLDFRRTKFNTTAQGTTRRSDPANVAWWLSRCMIERRQTPDDQATLSRQTLRILDAAFEAFATTNLSSSVSNPTVSTQTFAYSSSQNRNQPRYGLASTPYELGLVWNTAEQFRAVKEDFPSAEAMSDLCAIHVLRQAWSQVQTPRARAELLAHVQSSIEKAEPESRHRFLWKVAQASLQWWDRSQSNETARRTEESLTTMRTLFDLPQASPTLKLNIVAFHLNHEQHERALDLLDRITTTDGQQLKEIEQRAAQLAGKLRRVERVRVAAERLFGMRLEPQEELQLAATLSGLGLHEQAEAIRQRAPQRFGNDVGSLLALLEQRLKENKPNEAAEVAEQILLRTHPAGLAASAGGATGAGTQPSSQFLPVAQRARKKALETLASAGRLGPFIEQAEKQFDRSPQSLKLFGQLAELYAAEVPPQGGTTNGGANEKIARLLDRLADSDAPDPQFRLTLARALVSAGKTQLAGPHFLFAIERLPNATAQVLFETEQILSELGHTEELARIVLKSKLAVNDQQRIQLFSRIVSRLEGPPIRAKLIIRLFEKAFRDAPEFRPMLAAQLLAVSPPIWQEEELLPIARDLAVPPESHKSPGAWYGIDVSHLYNLDKQIDSITKRTVELAAQLKKLDELADFVEAAMKSHPDWTLGGNVTLGMIRLKQGKPDDAKKLFAVLVPKHATVAIPFGPKLSNDQAFDRLTCSIGVELAYAGDFEAAASFYELSSDIETVLNHCRNFGNQPAMQQLAVRIVNRMLAGLDNPAELTRQAGSSLFVQAAKITAEIRQPYVAARLTQAMITRWQLPNANNSDGGTRLEQLEHLFANARVAIKPQMLREILNQSTRRAGGVSPPVEANALPTTSAADPPTGGLTPPARQRPPVSRVAIDLLPHVTGDSLTNLRLDSPFVSLLKEAAKDKDLWAKWTAELGRAEGRQPPDDPPNPKDVRGLTSARSPDSRSDLSLAILASLTELAVPESNTVRTAVPRLIDVVKSHLKTERPRTTPPGFHPQLGLWLVARECLVREEYQKPGRELADLATESAALHFDPRFQWAILRERGELELKSGNKELAGKLWTRLSEDVLRPRSVDEIVPMLLGRHFAGSANWPSTRMHHARDLCHLTLNAQMPDLSLAIFRDAVNWPKTAPFVARFNNGAIGGGDVLMDANALAVFGLAEDILATWDTLEPEWRSKGVAADAIFATLLECVLPTNRPDEVFVFAVSSNAVRRAGGVSPPGRPERFNDIV